MTNLKSALTKLKQQFPDSRRHIDGFCHWLNDCTAARNLLAELAIEWPVPEHLPPVEEIIKHLQESGHDAVEDQIPDSVGKAIRVKNAVFFVCIHTKRWCVRTEEMKQTYLFSSAVPESVAKYISNYMRK